MSNRRVLFVDDDPGILDAHRRNYRKKFECGVALGPEEALPMLTQEEPYAVIVSDMRMPGMSGVEFLEKARESAPETVRMMLTGNIDQTTATDAINRGSVYRFLTKPCPAETLEASIEDAIRQYALITAEKQLLEKTLAGSIKVLIDILSLVEPQSFGIGQRLRDYVRLFLKTHRVVDGWALEIAALLSQLGYVTVPTSVSEKARKGAPLSQPEKDMISRVPGIGHDLLANIPRLETVSEIVRYQRKNYDGSGIPADAVAGEAIPYGSRLLRILTEFVALEGRGTGRLEAFIALQKEPDKFDPRIVVAVQEALGAGLVGSGLAGSPGGEGAVPRREVRLAQLQSGQRLVSNIMTPDGLVVVASGSEVTPVLLERIANFARIQRLIEPVLVEG